MLLDHGTRRPTISASHLMFAPLESPTEMKVCLVEYGSRSRTSLVLRALYQCFALHVYHLKGCPLFILKHVIILCSYNGLASLRTSTTEGKSRIPRSLPAVLGLPSASRYRDILIAMYPFLRSISFQRRAKASGVLLFTSGRIRIMAPLTYLCLSDKRLIHRTFSGYR